MDGSRGFEAWWTGRGLPENLKAAFFMAWKAALDSEANAKDANRYRWLRDQHIGDDPEQINLEPDPFGVPGEDYSEEYPVITTPLYK